MLTSLIEGFVKSRGTLAQNRRNTGLEKERSLTMFVEFLQKQKLEGEEASTAELTRANLIDFVSFYGTREGKRGSKSLSPRTVVKLVGHLREFSDYLTAHGKLTESPMDAPFDRAIAGLQSRASQMKGRRNYLPFTDANIRSIFNPQTYLRHNSAADDFWVPLLGLFTGARLGELVTLTLADVTVDDVSGIQVLLLDGKNENSRRAVPLAQTLLDIGFLDYVTHIRAMGAIELFPNRPMNPTREADPSKHLSRAFGEHLDRLSLTDPLLVFHSFRHTAISRMHVCEVPVADAELIVGHAAQDASVRSDAARSHASRPSVHLGTYMHAESYSVAGEPVMARLKRRIDASLTFELDVELLAKAAKIVSAHTRAMRTAGGKQVVRSGWHTNGKAACERAVSSLDTADAL